MSREFKKPTVKAHLIDSGVFTKVYYILKEGNNPEIKKDFLLHDKKERAKYSYENEIKLTEYLNKLGHSDIIPNIVKTQKKDKYYSIHYQYCGIDLFELMMKCLNEECYEDKLSHKKYMFDMKWWSSNRNNFIEQILNIVTILHGHDIVHLDIKLENFVIDLTTLKIKIIDFSGSYIDNGDNDMTNVIKYSLGTALYTSPENILEVDRTKSCDIWSTCVVIYIMFTQKNLSGLTCRVQHIVFTEDGRVYDIKTYQNMFDTVLKIMPYEIDNYSCQYKELQLFRPYFVSKDKRPTNFDDVLTILRDKKSAFANVSQTT